VQVKPMQPVLKAPGAKRLKLKDDELLSMFAFHFILRCYIKNAADLCTAPELLLVAAGALTLGVQTSATFARAVNADREVGRFRVFPG
jgi:hypothetical protein